jgi:hypothetical protein
MYISPGGSGGRAGPADCRDAQHGLGRASEACRLYARKTGTWCPSSAGTWCTSSTKPSAARPSPFARTGYIGSWPHTPTLRKKERGRKQRLVRIASHHTPTLSAFAAAAEEALPPVAPGSASSCSSASPPRTPPPRPPPPRPPPPVSEDSSRSSSTEWICASSSMTPAWGRGVQPVSETHSPGQRRSGLGSRARDMTGGACGGACKGALGRAGYAWRRRTDSQPCAGAESCGRRVRRGAASSSSPVGALPPPHGVQLPRPARTSCPSDSASVSPGPGSLSAAPPAAAAAPSPSEPPKGVKICTAGNSLTAWRCLRRSAAGRGGAQAAVRARFQAHGLPGKGGPCRARGQGRCGGPQGPLAGIARAAGAAPLLPRWLRGRPARLPARRPRAALGPRPRAQRPAQRRGPLDAPGCACCCA